MTMDRDLRSEERAQKHLSCRVFESFNRSMWVGLLLIWLGSGATTVQAGGADLIEAYSVNPKGPGDLERYVAGDLGVVGRQYGVPNFWIAYRHLNGLPVPSSDVIFGERSSGSQVDAHGVWLEARKGIAGLEPGPSWINAQRSKKVVFGSGRFESYEYFPNCLDDAFVTAAETLQARQETFGPNGKEVLEWTRGQDTVFSNCQDGRSIPEPLDASWPDLLRADRAYQTAAAYLYAVDYPAAEQHFRVIAKDDGSPWRYTANFVVARILARQERFAEAIEHLNGVLADPEHAAFHRSARGLIDHFSFRADPVAMRAVLARRLASTELPATVAQDLSDLHWALELEPQPQDEMTAWLRLMHRAAQEYPAVPLDARPALDRWLNGEGAHWWLAAAMASSPSDWSTRSPELARRLLSKVPAAEGPGRLSIIFHRLQLQAEVGGLDTPEHEAELVSVLKEDLNRSDRNRFNFMYRLLAADLETYLQRSLHQLAASGYGSPSAAGFPAEGTQPTPEIFDSVAVSALNRLSVGRLFKLAAEEWLPEPHRDRFAMIAWVRAILLGQWDVAVGEASLVAERVPSLANDLLAFSQATEQERAFVAALTLLRAPQISAFIYSGGSWAIDLHERPTSGQAWWCSDDADVVWQDNPAVGRITEGSPEQRHRIEPAPLHFGPVILDYSDAHRDDPRVPEALHLLVRSTRISCGYSAGGTFGSVSKAAFTRLHRRYPSSPWTEETPYWFD